MYIIILQMTRSDGTQSLIEGMNLLGIHIGLRPNLYKTPPIMGIFTHNGVGMGCGGVCFGDEGDHDPSTTSVVEELQCEWKENINLRVLTTMQP